MKLRKLAGALVLAACGNDFDPPSRVTDLRLLLVQADKPYALPGETVRLDALAIEPFGRELTWAWSTCVRPPDTTAQGCLAKLVLDAQASGQPPPFVVGTGLASHTVTMPASILDGVPDAALPGATLGVVTVACPGELSLLDLSTLRPGELPVRCVERGTGTVLPFERYGLSVKRLFPRRRDRNQNPPIEAIRWDGAPWPEGEVREVMSACTVDTNDYEKCEGGEPHGIAAILAPGAVEGGVDELGEAFTEQAVVQYYATEGIFEFEGRVVETPETQWKARASSRGRDVTMWFVARDNRGGVSFTTRQVRVR